MWGNQKGGEIFKMKGGNLIFRVEFRDRKGQKWGLLEINDDKSLQNRKSTKIAVIVFIFH